MTDSSTRRGKPRSLRADVGKPATARGRRSSGSSRPAWFPSRCARRRRGRRARRPSGRQSRTLRRADATRRSCRRRARAIGASAANSRATSSAGRLAVGSSSTRISASAASALAIATRDFSVRLRLWIRSVGVDVGAERFQRGGGAPARRGPIDQAVAARKTEGETDVLGDGHPIDQAEILMDEGDRQAPQRIRHVGAAKGHSCPCRACRPRRGS